MADVNNTIATDADWILDYLSNSLEDLDETLACWEALARHERIDVWAEWPLKQDKLAKLDDLADRNELSTVQEARHQALKRHFLRQNEQLQQLIQGRDD